MTAVLVPRETLAGETRVAATPETVGKMVKGGASRPAAHAGRRGRGGRGRKSSMRRARRG